MDQNQLKDQISEVLAGIVDRIGVINEPADRDMLMDVDIVMEDTRRLYRLLYRLHKSAKQDGGGVSSSAASREPVSANQNPEIPVSAPPPVDPAPTKAELPFEEFASKTKPESAPDALARKKETPPMPSSKKPVNDLLPGGPGQVIADMFSADDNSLHRRVSGMREDKSIGTRMQRNPIANLKDAIGLNEKFLFINELFNGNIQAYNEAIAQLNDKGSASDAFDFLNELAKIHNWESDRSSATIEMLANYVQRRFIEP